MADIISKTIIALVGIAGLTYVASKAVDNGTIKDVAHEATHSDIKLDFKADINLPEWLAQFFTNNFPAPKQPE